MLSSSHSLKSVLLAATFGIGMASCSDSKFSGSAGQTDKDSFTNTPTPLEPLTSPTPNPSPDQEIKPDQDCMEDGVVKFQYDAKVQNCIDQGQLYNFDNGGCSAVRSAKFKCDFDSLIGQVQAAEMDGSKIRAGQQRGDLLIGCGQSQDEATIVAQWYKRPSTGLKSCELSKAGGTVTTGCYKNYGSNPEPKLETSEQVRSFVAACMSTI